VGGVECLCAVLDSAFFVWRSGGVPAWLWVVPGMVGALVVAAVCGRVVIQPEMHWLGSFGVCGLLGCISLPMVAVV